MAMIEKELARDTFPRERYAVPAMNKQIIAEKAITISNGIRFMAAYSFQNKS
jgi:hypothetical protein